MGQIFATLLPCLYRTKIQKFSDIQNDRPLKLARRVKRKSSHKDAVYNAELPGAVNEHNEYERGDIYLQPREITLIEKVKEKVVEKKIVRLNQECRWIGKRRFPQKKRVKNANEKQKTRKTGEDAQKSPTARNEEHKSSGLNCKKMDCRPKQYFFYKVTFGAKVQSRVEITVLPTVERNVKTCHFEETAKSGSGDHKREKSTSNSASADPGLKPLTNFQKGKSLGHKSYPADFYTATFGAKASSSTSKGEKTSSTDTSRKKKKNKKRSAAKLKIPSFLRRNKNSKGKKKDNIGERKCKEEDESENPNQESDNGCKTPVGNVKTICVKSFAASSLTSVDSGSQEQTGKPEIKSEDLEQAPQPEVKTKSLTSVDDKQASKQEMEIISLTSVDAINEEQTLKPEIKTLGLKPEELTINNKVSKAEIEITSLTSVSPRNDEGTPEPEVKLQGKGNSSLESLEKETSMRSEGFTIDNKIPKSEMEITSLTSVSTRNDEEDTPEPEVKLQGKGNSSLESLEKEKFMPSGGDKLVRDDEHSGHMESNSKKANNEKMKKKSWLLKGARIPKIKINRKRLKKDQSAREPDVELQKKDKGSQEIRKKGDCAPSRRDILIQNDEQSGHTESISQNAKNEKIKKKSRLFKGARIPKIKIKRHKQKKDQSVREPEVVLQEKDNSSQEIREKGQCTPSRRELTRDDQQPGHIESISKKANSEKIKNKSRLFQGFRLPKLKSKTNRQKEEKSVIKLTQEKGLASPSTQVFF